MDSVHKKYSQVSHEVAPDGLLGLLLVKVLQTGLVVPELVGDLIDLLSAAGVALPGAVLLTNVQQAADVVADAPVYENIKTASVISNKKNV